MIDVFLQAQEPDYFHYLHIVVEKAFDKFTKISKMVKNDRKFGKIISHVSLKVTHR